MPETGEMTQANMPGGFEGFVSSLYQQFLGREADAEGLAAYVRLLRNGLPIQNLIATFLASDELLERQRRQVNLEAVRRVADGGPIESRFDPGYNPPGEAGRSYLQRLRSGFLDRYCAGPVILDVGFSGYENPEGKTGVPDAIGIDVDYPGYDGLQLPFEDGSVDTIFSSHCLEHIQFDHAAIRDWYRVLKIGGFIVCMVPSQALYEKRRFLPSRFNADHKRMYTPSSLLRSFEESLDVNSYRVRHLMENDRGFNYDIGPEQHSDGALEIELVVEKIRKPDWNLAD